MSTRSICQFKVCEFAEVLYPGEVSIDFLRRVYVVRGEDADEVYAQMNMIGVSGIDVIVDPKKFGPGR